MNQSRFFLFIFSLLLLWDILSTHNKKNNNKTAVAAGKSENLKFLARRRRSFKCVGVCACWCPPEKQAKNDEN